MLLPSPLSPSPFFYTEPPVWGNRILAIPWGGGQEWVSSKGCSQTGEPTRSRSRTVRPTMGSLEGSPDTEWEAPVLALHKCHSKTHHRFVWSGVGDGGHQPGFPGA